MRRLVLFFLLCFNLAFSIAQDMPIGQWQSLVPYSSASSVCTGNGSVYCGLYGLLQYDVQEGVMSTRSKVEGLSDIDIIHLNYDESTEALVIVYKNYNIDLLKKGRIINLPYLKNFLTVASKDVNGVKIFNGKAYLASGIGIVVIDLEREEIKETYPMQVNNEQAIVNDICFLNNKIYCFSNKGIFSGDVQNPLLQNIDNWTKLSDSVFMQAFASNNLIYAHSSSSLYSWDGSSAFTSVFTTNLSFKKGEVQNNKLYLSAFQGYGRVYVFENAALSDSVSFVNPADVAYAYGNYWVADMFSGLSKINAAKEITPLKPSTVYDINCYNIKHLNNQFWVCGGGTHSLYNFLFLRSGLSVLDQHNWTYINQYLNVPAMDSLLDILDVEIDPGNKKVYAASHGGGILELNADYSFNKVFKTDVLEPAFATAVRATNLKMDENRNLWATLCYANNNLNVKDKNGNWYAYSINTGPGDRILAHIEIDNGGQKWLNTAINGIVVFDDNGTLSNKNDDKQKRLTVGSGFGNLASNIVNCIVKDKDGALWIGTDNGISILYNPESALSSTNFDAVNKIVQFNVIDSVANYLFINEDVRTIAVDGANRKWVGTANGVWLISADGEKQVYNFNKSNSPLPSNEIRKISIDPQTGVVYIATVDYGIWAFRSTATEGQAGSEELSVFPNPVPHQYNGTVAIKGLVENADVKIVDEAGQLIYKTKALGGQAVWNGMSYTGIKPQSGVYYVIASNEDGSSTVKGKFVIID